jgi:hypothetical protein
MNYIMFIKARNSACLAARCINKKYSIGFYLAIALKEGGRYKKDRNEAQALLPRLSQSVLAALTCHPERRNQNAPTPKPS